MSVLPKIIDIWNFPSRLPQNFCTIFSKQSFFFFLQNLIFCLTHFDHRFWRYKFVQDNGVCANFKILRICRIYYFVAAETCWVGAYN